VTRRSADPAEVGGSASCGIRAHILSLFVDSRQKEKGIKLVSIVVSRI
jgi:hypothetical protein